MSRNNIAAAVTWIWPVRLSNSVAARVDAATSWLHDWQSVAFRWFTCSLMIGTLPVVLSCELGFAIDRALSAVLTVPLLLGAVRGDRIRQGTGILLTVFASHSATVIAISALQPTIAADLYPHGEAYWQETHAWIVTGQNPEYELSSWVPAHIQALFGVPLASFITLGGALLAQGLYQVDMMNVYVGNLLTTSSNPVVAVGLGWHPWSMLRGMGFLILGLEAVSLSLQRLIRTPLSSRKSRRCRWCLGIGFLLADATVKFACMESVRNILQSNLLDSGG